MIKAVKGNMIILGLSDENINRLQNGLPIKFNLKDLGLQDMDVVIFHGKTEFEMKQTMFKAGLVHPTKTQIKDDSSKDN